MSLTTVELPKIRQLDLRPPMRQYDQDALDTLEFINSVRADLDMLPIKELPKGRPSASHDCVIARALTEDGYMASATGTGTAVVREDTVRMWQTPETVGRFISRFDEGAYPFLVDRGLR